MDADTGLMNILVPPKKSTHALTQILEAKVKTQLVEGKVKILCSC